jgi:tRNA (guanine-N7-)-methyltransferase
MRMYANSNPIISAQTGMHEQLPNLVAKHAAHAFLKPVAPYNRAAFDASMQAWQMHGTAQLIVDAGCGVGLSSMHLAAQYPDHFVIGIDQSADRLERNASWEGNTPANMVLVRADLVDYWRLLHAAGAKPARHYILYPNPWPKIGHVSRRWHGHPVFPTIAALGGQLECRSNWHIYIEEFSAAMHQLTGASSTIEQYKPAMPITPFERKYLDSGHALWRIQLNLCTISASPENLPGTGHPIPDTVQTCTSSCA